MSAIFAYPATPPHTQIISIRNPELGDSQQVNLKTMYKQNMDGAIHTHKKTPTNSKLLLTFRTLPLLQKDALVDFYNNHIGQVIEYTDFNLVEWQCRIANDSLVVTTIQDGCSYDVIIELITV